MMRPLKRENIFFGWWTVLVTGIISGLGIGFYFYGISALFKPIASELGLTRAIVSGAAGMGTMVGSLLAPLIGFITDKWGPKLAIVLGLLTAVLGLALMPFVRSALGLYLVWGLLTGAGVNLGMTIAIDKALANWFVTKIGLAMGTKFAILDLIGSIALPCVSWLITRVGWRMTCLIWGVVLLIGLPFILIFVRNRRPEFYGSLPDGDAISQNSEGRLDTAIDRAFARSPNPAETEFSLREAMKTKAYWILTLSFSVQFFVMIGFNTHCIPFLTEIGFDSVVAGVMMGIMLALTIPSRFLGGFLADHVSKERLNLMLGLPFFLQTIGIGAFLISKSAFTVYVLLVLYGIAHGLPTALLIVMVSRYFGRKAFGSIFGTFFLFGSPAPLISPVLTGWLFDRTGSYVIALILFASLSLFVTVLLNLLKPPIP
jgi:cyanate permease